MLHLLVIPALRQRTCRSRSTCCYRAGTWWCECCRNISPASTASRTRGDTLSCERISTSLALLLKAERTARWSFSTVAAAWIWLAEKLTLFGNSQQAHPPSTKLHFQPVPNTGISGMGIKIDNKQSRQRAAWKGTVVNRTIVEWSIDSSSSSISNWHGVRVVGSPDQGY